jgi:hypothetical protein
MMLASGMLSVSVLLSEGATGITTNELGAIPKVHIICAPMQTCIGMATPSWAGLLYCNLRRW